MVDYDVSGSASNSSESESLSWIANHIDWDYESDETGSEIIFNGPLDSKNAVDLVGHNDEDTVSDAESAVRNVPLTMDLGILSNDELSPQGRIFVRGIWWDSS